MSETKVYINAPTLDNSDRSYFLKNEELQYISAGEQSLGDVARFPLYEKFLENTYVDPTDNYFIPKTNFIERDWLIDENGNAIGLDGEASLGGDYHENGHVRVCYNNFKTGEITGFKFKFFNKRSATSFSVANNVKAFVFLYVSQDDGTYATHWKVAAYGEFVNYDSETGWSEFRLVDENKNPISYLITGNTTSKSSLSFTFEFLNTDNKSSVQQSESESDLDIMIRKFPVTNEWTLNQLKSPLGDAGKVCMRSLPRPSTDSVSYVANLSGTQGITAGQSRLIEFQALMNLDTVSEFLKSEKNIDDSGNSEKNHLTSSEVMDIEMLKYSAPQLVLPMNARQKILSFYKIYICHDSVTKYGLVDCIGGKVSGVIIPFVYSADDDDYYDAGHHGVFKNDICQNNKRIQISFDGETYVTSDNSLNFSYFGKYKNDSGDTIQAGGEQILKFTFDNITDKEALKYKGNGIWIIVSAASGSNAAGVCYYNIGTGDNVQTYSYTPKPTTDVQITPPTGIVNYDWVIPSGNHNIAFILTPHIKVMFDYSRRSGWFDSLNTYTSELMRKVVYDTNRNIIGMEIGNNWKLCEDSAGNLVAQQFNPDTKVDIGSPKILATKS